MPKVNDPKIKSLPSSELLLFSFQIVIIFIVVCASLINLTFQWGNQNLWTIILTSSLGYIMPNPKLNLTNSKKEMTVNETAESTK